MINITQDSSQYVDLSLSELITMVNPYFIFKWVDKYSAEEIKTYEDISEYPDRYNRFYIVDASNFNLKYSGTYSVYESLVDSSTIDASMHLLESGQYTYHKKALGYVVFDPSYAVVDGYKVFNPVFNVNSGAKYFQDPSVVEIYTLLDTSLAEVTQGYVDGSLATRDLSINELYTLTGEGCVKEASLGTDFVWTAGYLDVSIVSTDASVNDLYEQLLNLEQAVVGEIQLLKDYTDSSMATIDASIVRIDGSINYLFENSGAGGLKEASLGTDFYWDAGYLDISTLEIEDITYSKEYIDGSLSRRDISINNLMIENDSQDASIVLIYSYIDGSLSARDLTLSVLATKDITIDASIVRIDGSINSLFNKNISQDASIVALRNKNTNIDTSLNDLTIYVDGSLNNKLYNTTDTFTGTLTIDGSLYLIGDMYVDGSSYIIKAQSLDVSNNFITLRDGAAVQIPDGSISGLRIIKADGTNNVIFGTGNDAILRIGWETDSLQAIATRENIPTNGWYAYWDDASSMFKTRDLKGYVDGSLGLRDVSINNLKIKNDSQDASIVVLQGNITTLTNKNTSQDASIVRIDGSINYLFSNSGVGKVKEASLGDDFYWNAGYLDVSVMDASAYYYDKTTIDSFKFIKEVSLNESKFKWDGGYLEPSVAGSGGGSIATLTDVSIVSVADNNILIYDSSNEVWKNGAAVDLSVYDVVDASEYFWIFKDVSLTSPTENQVLAYNATADIFVNKTIDTSLYEYDDASLYFQQKIALKSPSTGAAGTAGDLAYDTSGYVYVCVSTNSWRRAQLTTY